ncbi:hypothetical protein [Kocuria sabuli]
MTLLRATAGVAGTAGGLMAFRVHLEVTGDAKLPAYVPGEPGWE